MAANPNSGPNSKPRYVLRLFIAGNAANSRIARENLERFQAKFSNLEFTIEVIDLNLKPEMALEHGVFLSPAVQVVEPQGRGIIFGNLSDEQVLKRALNL